MTARNVISETAGAAWLWKTRVRDHVLCMTIRRLLVGVREAEGWANLRKEEDPTDVWLWVQVSNDGDLLVC